MPITATRFLCFSFLFFAPFRGMDQTPDVLLLNAKRLVAVKNNWKKDRDLEVLVKSLQKQADRLLLITPVSVMDKAATPESGTKHDYMSQAPYFWYDSSKPNGKPYIRRDGQHNPETYKIADHKNLADLSANTQALALAWYLTGDEKYAKKATILLRYWFFDEATKMNPNLDYAQAVPGVNNGRGIGIIESIALTGIADASSLMRGSKSWTPKDEKALKSWYGQYLHWMLNSRNGQDEHAAKNNHGTWYYVQSVDFALFSGDKATAQQLAKESRDILDGQITKEGMMPLELERTNALAYSTYNLQGWFRLATLAEKTGVDLWNYRNKQGATIRTAMDWLKPYAM
ncbi:MAG: alginate lyase family protein, partial [Bacteroidetes bacterium]|nr:alginate lyase family protein [Bacteroidota bacterium]